MHFLPFLSCGSLPGRAVCCCPETDREAGPVSTSYLLNTITHLSQHFSGNISLQSFTLQQISQEINGTYVVNV